MRTTTLHVGTLSALVLVAACLVGCNDSSSGGGGHPTVALRDRFGNTIDELSVEPYSSTKTCGPCHDFETIANGYHFQQGRTDLDGNIVMKDDYFEDGRDFLLSAGMFGKW